MKKLFLLSCLLLCLLVPIVHYTTNAVRKERTNEDAPWALNQFITTRGLVKPSVALVSSGKIITSGTDKKTIDRVLENLSKKDEFDRVVYIETIGETRYIPTFDESSSTMEEDIQKSIQDGSLQVKSIVTREEIVEDQVVVENHTYVNGTLEDTVPLHDDSAMIVSRGALQTRKVIEEANLEEIEKDNATKDRLRQISQGEVFSHPSDQRLINSYFGGRWGGFHNGIDVEAHVGDPIYATKSGLVVFAGYEWDYGYYVIIDHGEGFSSLYAHLNEILVEDGDWVKQGSIIAEAGNTGWSTGAHLHFEIRVDDVPQDPLDYVRYE